MLAKSVRNKLFPPIDIRPMTAWNRRELVMGNARDPRLCDVLLEAQIAGKRRTLPGSTYWQQWQEDYQDGFHYVWIEVLDSETKTKEWRIYDDRKGTINGKPVWF